MRAISYMGERSKAQVSVSRRIRSELRKARNRAVSDMALSKEEQRDLIISKEALAALKRLTPQAADPLVVLDYYRAHNPDISDSMMPEKLTVAYWLLCDKDERMPGTQVELAHMLGVDEKTIYRWIQDRTAVDLAENMRLKLSAPALRDLVIKALVVRLADPSKANTADLKLAAEITDLKGSMSCEDGDNGLRGILGEDGVAEVGGIASLSAGTAKRSIVSRLQEGSAMQMVK